MADAPEANQTTEAPKQRGPKGEPGKPNLGRATLRTLGRKKRKLKLMSNKEFAKAYFEGKSKRSNDKKATFRKKKKGKK